MLIVICYILCIEPTPALHIRTTLLQHATLQQCNKFTFLHVSLNYASLWNKVHFYFDNMQSYERKQAIYSISLNGSALTHLRFFSNCAVELAPMSTEVTAF